MAKISIEERHKYQEKIKPYTAAIKILLDKERQTLQIMGKAEGNLSPMRIALAEDMLNLSSYYLVINGVCSSMLKNKNEDALNEGRKSLYKSVIYLEAVVSNLVDAPYSEYEDKLDTIAFMSSAERYRLARKLGLAIQLLENAYGINTKWRWVFVDMEGRYAVVAKNLIDMKNAITNTDPRSPNYEPTFYHLALVKKLLTKAADRYRERYELSTDRIDDFKVGINFLNALRRFCFLLGNRDDAEMIRKKIISWSAKLDLDIKNKLSQEPFVTKKTN